MARILKEQTIIKDNIIQHLQNTYAAQNTRLQGTPVYVTYWNKNLLSSEQDKTLENVTEILGVESPLTYNKINDFPLYLVGEVNPNYEITEFGINTSGSGEAVILPNTIRPYVDDVFSINYINEEFLFRVTQVEFDRINGKKFYKIQYSISSYKQDEADEKVDTEYDTKYENIGTERNPIIESSTFKLVEELEDLIEKLRKFYLKSFMNKKYNVLIYHYNDKWLYNEFIIKFILDNKILESTKKRILDSYYIQDIFSDSLARTEIYKHTIYYALEEHNPKYFKFENMATSQIQKDYKESPFAVDYEDYYRVIYAENSTFGQIISELDRTYELYKDKTVASLNYDDVFGKQNNSSYQFLEDYFPDYELGATERIRHIKIIPHNDSFVTNVNNCILFDDKELYFYENLIILYLNDKLEIDHDLIEMISKHDNYPRHGEFLLIPCIIFILKMKIKQLTNK